MNATDTLRQSQSNSVKRAIKPVSIPSNIHSKFNMMQLFYQNTDIFKEYNVHRYELIDINQTLRNIKNSRNDLDVKWHKEFTNTVMRQEFYVKYYLTLGQ